MFLQQKWLQTLVSVILVITPAFAIESREFLSPEESEELLWCALHVINNFKNAGAPELSQVSFVKDLGRLAEVSRDQDLSGEWCAKAILSKGGHFQIYIRPESATWILAVRAYHARNFRSPMLAELAVELATARFKVVYPERNPEAYRVALRDHILDELGFVRFSHAGPRAGSS
jgi:hypothetical protein